MSTSSQTDSGTTARDEFIDGVRAFADFLEQHPNVREPQRQRLLLALLTNDAAEAFAAEHNLTVEYDDKGNASCDLTFGPVVYHAYGYRDFAKHCEESNERQARRWVESKGLAIVPQSEGAQDKQPETPTPNSLWSCGECHAINNADPCMVCRTPRTASVGGSR